VQKNANQNQFTVQAEDASFAAPRLVVATGGLSIAKIGATPFGYDLARQFGLRIQPPRPALVPLVFSERDRKRWCDLAGVSTEVVASTPGSKQAFRENMLVTHHGISGPAILQISSYWDGKEPIHLDLAPGSQSLPPSCETRPSRSSRAGNRCCEKSCPAASPIAGSKPILYRQLRSRLRRRRTSTACVGIKSGKATEGYGKAEVTAGGVDTGELSAKTMEARKVPGLFFIGEVVDVTGQLGGFNFQWAWASGFCAGQAV
jgi:predicted Rossmann fold flavoprotein